MHVKPTCQRLGLLLLVVLASCGRGEAPVAPQEWVNLSSAAAPYSGTTLRILGEDLPPLHSLNKLRSEFTDQTGISLEIDFKNHSRVIQSILEGAVSRDFSYDIIFVPHKELGRLIAVDAATPLSVLASNASLRDPDFNPGEEFFEPFWTEVSTYQGRWYAMPLYLGGSIVVYRKDLLSSSDEAERYRQAFAGQELKEPETFDEWLRLAEFFHRPHHDPPLYGISLLMSDESLWYNWQSVLFSFGGDVIDAEHGWEYGEVVADSEAAIEATKAYKQLSTYAPPDAATYSWGLGITKQQAGVSFMTLLQYDVVAEFEDPNKTPFAGKFGYFVPRAVGGGCASQLESWVGFIPSTSTNAEAAWLLLQWMMGADVQLQMHLEGNISPRRSTYEDEAVMAMEPTPAILESLGCMTPKPTFPEATAIQDILTRKLQAVLRDELAAEQALSDAAALIRARLSARESSVPVSSY